MSPILHGLKVVPAFMWTSTGYRAQIRTLFPRVPCLTPTPFQGMTDLLLIGDRSLGIVDVSETDNMVCSIEVGRAKQAVSPVTISRSVKV